VAHIQDLWERTVDGRRERTDRFGRGRRWQVRYLDPDGHHRSRTFARKVDAERFAATTVTDVLRGSYIDPNAGRITFEAFARAWLGAQTFNESTREAVALRLRLHAFPTLGPHELRDLRPSLIQSWLRGLQMQLAPTYTRVVFANVSSVLSAAVDDRLIVRNPCSARSIRRPKAEPRKVVPWPPETVAAVIHALPLAYRAVALACAGCGLRQGEAFGLRVEDVDFLARELHVEQQVKILGGRVVIARPKGGKTRTIPLPDSVGLALADRLVFTSREHKPLNRNHFNRYVWRSALLAAGVTPGPGNGMHALRHFYASVLIDAGESVRAVADYLGHADPGFTLRVYAHLFPSSAARARHAVDAVLQGDHGETIEPSAEGRERARRSIDVAGRSPRVVDAQRD
jgi:integrase